MQLKCFATFCLEQHHNITNANQQVARAVLCCVIVHVHVYVHVMQSASPPVRHSKTDWTYE